MPEAPATTIEQVRAGAAQQRADAAACYRELLLRQGAPHDGDADALAGAMAVLGRTADDLSEDLAVVQSFAALEAAEQAVSEFTEPAAAARQAARAVETREEARLSKARERCEAATRTAWKEASRIQGKLDAARAEHSRHWDARNAWEAIAEGVSVDEIRARRRAANRRSLVTPEPATVESEPMVSEAVAQADEPDAAAGP